MHISVGSSWVVEVAVAMMPVGVLTAVVPWIGQRAGTSEVSLAEKELEVDVPVREVALRCLWWW